MALASRRQFLALGALSSLALGLGGAALRWFRSGYALSAGEVALGLEAKGLCVARAVVDTLAPGDAELPGGVELGVHQRIDEQLFALDEATRRELAGALEVIEHVPPLLGYPGRFTRLPRDARADVMRKLLASRRDLFVQVAAAYKQLVQILYYSDARVYSKIGYDGPWVKEEKPPESAILYARLLEERRRRG